MRLSDVSVQRPVLAMVIASLIVAFGLLALTRLPLQEYPTIEPPVVSIRTSYPGASADVVETRITQVLEERIAGIAGIEVISSTSQDGSSNINIEFSLSSDIDAAANDVRDRISGAADNLPDEADPPEVRKEDANSETVMWLMLAGDGYTTAELTDYAERYLVDSFSVQEGVSSVRVGGSREYAMRVWLDSDELAARGLTVGDVEDVLRAENVELPGGSVESQDRQFVVRLPRSFSSPEDFRELVLDRGENDYLVRLADVARVELGTVEERSLFRGNGKTVVGLGIIKQSNANVMALSKAVRAEMERVSPRLPEGMTLTLNHDSSTFVAKSIQEVVSTLIIAIGLVVVSIFVFLGNIRTTLIPAITVPITLVGTFAGLAALGFSINLLTLLALVLAIGLVVDDAIIMLENIHRRMQLYGETPLVAAYRGARQLAFAVLATSMVLVAVFVPLSFVQGDVGKLFTEFALTLSTAVAISTLLALTLTPMMASRILTPSMHEGRLAHWVDSGLKHAQGVYRGLLERVLKLRWLVVVAFCAMLGGIAWLYPQLPAEYTPREDRGTFFVLVNGPPGATFSWMEDYMDEVEARIMPLTEKGEVERVLVISPMGRGNVETFNSGFAIVGLSDWEERRPAWPIMNEVRQSLSQLPGISAFPIMSQGFGGGSEQGLQFVLGGGSYEQLVTWRDALMDYIRQTNPKLINLESDYEESQPQLSVNIDYTRAADLGVTVTEIGRTLETLLGGRTVTRFTDQGEEYDVILEAERGANPTPAALDSVRVRSNRTGELVPLSSLVDIESYAGPSTLNRYNRLRAITLQADLADGYSMGEALDYLDQAVSDILPSGVQTDVKGAARDYRESTGATTFLLVLGAVVVFLVLAAQFESFVHPLVIMLTVPLAIGGALLGLWATGQTLNIYSQVGLVMLVGLATKNGILIVEFANQLRDEGIEFREALIRASLTRLRPIVMTSVTTIAGSIPLILSSGAGAETRMVIGTVIFTGVAAATFFTLFVVPVAYEILARRTGSPGDVARKLERELENSPDAH
ncbi:efflux RND transporter permease subunit [Halomonas huangheensis]|uniref:Multidrug transporter n=1 Tax=Halomonas huangheensis TaxID=1178482 RepID=W1N5W1_9GAMM|nr:efflux RND transporter permease subunit [Halomonas huangheensis]ALM52016.1 multidrug transporter AcrB [Halomonas huangheensis]ERL50566.1 multidrug transporter [Halomonas huangheensis]